MPISRKFRDNHKVSRDANKRKKHAKRRDKRNNRPIYNKFWAKLIAREEAHILTKRQSKNIEKLADKMCRVFDAFYSRGKPDFAAAQLQFELMQKNEDREVVLSVLGELPDLVRLVKYLKKSA